MRGFFWYARILQLMEITMKLLKLQYMLSLPRGLICDLVICSTSSWLLLPEVSIASQPVVHHLPPACLTAPFVRQAHVNQTAVYQICVQCYKGNPHFHSHGTT